MEEFIIKDGCKRVIVDFDARTIVQEFEEKFEPKNGDFITVRFSDGGKTIAIFNKVMNDEMTFPSYYYIYAGKSKSGLLLIDYGFGCDDAISWSESTDSERQQLIDDLAKEGKAWDAENKMIVKKRWRAEFGGVYWSITHVGNVRSFTDVGGEISTSAYNFGNYHKTREDAEAYMGKIFKLRND